jgi:hypothetical protein
LSKSSKCWREELCWDMGKRFDHDMFEWLCVYGLWIILIYILLINHM